MTKCVIIQVIYTIFMYTILDLKNELTGIGHGLSLNKVYSPNSVIDRASRTLHSSMDFFELVEEKQIANSIYDSIYDYPAPESLKMDKIIGIYPQTERDLADTFEKKSIEQFDREKALGSDKFTVQYRNGTKILRVAKNTGITDNAPISIGDFSTINGNGTWTLGGDAQNLRTDKGDFMSGTASLSFDLSGLGTDWFIENNGIDSLDLTLKKDGSIFNWIFLPTANPHSLVTMRIGSSLSDYYEITETRQLISAFVDGWNQLENKILDGTVVGSPDLSNVTYIRIGGTYNGTAVEGIKVDSAVSILGTKYLVRYYSDNMFKDAVTNDTKDRISDDSDIVLLESVAFSGLVFKSAEFMAQQIQDQGGSIDVEYFLGQFISWRNEYAINYKSQKKHGTNRYWNGRARMRSRNVR